MAAEFVRHALSLGAERVVMLLRLLFLESASRCDILDNSGPARLHIFRDRVPMHHAHWEGEKDSPQLAVTWFVWERNYRGPKTWNRLWFEPPPTTGKPEAGE